MSHMRSSRRTRRKPAPRNRPLACQRLESRRLLAAGVGDDNFGVGDQLRNYRLAVAATAEYTGFHGGQAGALTAIQNLVAEINEIFEEELSIHFDLVSGTNTIFTNTLSDGYSNGNTSQMLGANTGILNGIIGSANYDIGHVLGTTGSGGSGLGGLGVVNNASRKGEGASVSEDPQGASFVNLVAHEFGHQFAADHTFNANSYGSTTGSRSSSNAFEPASGSTIMSYAGIAADGFGNDNLQESPEDYFHSASFEQIAEFVAGSGGPNTTTATANSIPTVNAGADYTIPAGTPFELSASGTDADSGDTLTYTWEQLDLGPAMSLPLFDNGSSPIFRTFKPTTANSRVFPRLSDLVDNVNTAAIGEVLPTTTRSLNFRTTVRDGRTGVGSDDVLISVVGGPTTSPFAVTSPNTAVNWTGGTTQTVTWNVGGSDGNGIDVANVAIDLSLDGGLTYPVTLASTTANDGSHAINVPNFDAAEARIRVRSLGNIFFDISNVDFTITADTGAPGFTVVESGGSTLVGEEGLVGGQATDTYTIARNTTGAGTTVVAVNADGETEISTDGVNFSSSISLSLSGSTSQTVHVRGVDDTLREGIHSGLVTHSVTSSTDLAYSTATIVQPVATTIADDELQPLVGVDFDEASSTSTPTNWTKISQTFGGTTSNLIREDGFVTGIGLTIETEGAAGLNPSEANDVPFHTPILDGIDGNHLADDSLKYTWTGLTPGRDYNIYLLTAEYFAGATVQNVSVTAGVRVPDFTQDTTAIDNELLVNTGIANSDKTLEADALMVQADANGEIQILVTDSSAGGAEDAIVSGAAIQEVGPDILGFSIDVSDNSTEVSEAGTQDSFDVVLTSQPSGNVVINVASGDTDEATVRRSDLDLRQHQLEHRTDGDGDRS